LNGRLWDDLTHTKRLDAHQQKDSPLVVKRDNCGRLQSAEARRITKRFLDNVPKLLARVCLGVAALFVLPGELAAELNLGIVPKPRQVAARNGQFQVSQATKIVLAAGASNDARFAAADLNRALKEILGFELATVNAREGAATTDRIVIGRPRTDALVASLLEQYGLKLTDAMGREGYVLGIGNEGIVIGASDGPGLLYGTMSLRQMLRTRKDKLLPAVAVHDWPAVKMRGIQDEFSYGQVSTMSNFKDIIRFLAEYKMNTEFYYFEDTFRFKKYATIGVGRGAMTREQALELQAFAKPYNVQIIPIFEMLGNQGALLLLDEVRPFAEYPGSQSFSVDDDAFAFLANCFGELADTFESPYFHVGLDESWDLGFGKSEARVNREGRGAVHAAHYRRIHDLVTGRGKKMIMYADIILERPEILDMIPKDIILMDWHYEPRQHYPSVPTLARHGFPLMVLPGMNNWDRIFPELSAAMINIRNFTLDGIHHKALGSFTSTWGDNGSKNLRELLYYGYAYGAEVTWSPEATDVGDFSERFCTQFYGPHTAVRLQAVYALLEKWPWWFPLLDYFRHPFLPRKNERPHTEQELYRVGEDARVALGLIEGLRGRVERRKGDLDYLQYCARMHLHYVAGQRLVRDLEQFNKAGKSAAELARSRGEFLKRIQAVRDETVALRDMYRELWLRTNLPANLNYPIEDYDRLVKVWEDAYERASHDEFAYDPRTPAQWIYHPAGFTEHKRVPHAFFRRSFKLGEEPPRLAGMQLYGDTHIKVFVNGKLAGEQFARQNLSAPVKPLLVRFYDIKPLLKPGENVIAVEARNYGTEKPNIEPGGPARCAGLHFDGEIVDREGRVQPVLSDAQWKVTDQESQGWTTTGFDDSAWLHAQADPKPTVWVTSPDFAKGVAGFWDRR